MKKFYLFLQTFLLAVLLIGCQFSEELHFTEDGSGKISFNFDGSELMQMGGDKISEGNEEVIDSLLVFKDFLEEKKDSISKLPIDQQEKLKKLESFSMHMLMNPEAKEMKFNLFSDFKKIEDLGDVFNNFKTASSIGNKNNQAANPLSVSNGEDPTRVIYSYEKNKFKRVTEILDEEKLKMGVDSLEQMKMFLASSKYKINYHFPKKIKNISSEKALFSQDGKSFTLEVGFLEFMEDPRVLDLEVELEE